MTKRVLLLDLGRVVVDFDFARFREPMQALTGLDVAGLREAVTGEDLARRFEAGQLSDREFHAAVCRRMGVEVPWKEFTEAWNRIFLPEPLLGDEVLEALSARSDIWIVSNTNRIHFDFLKTRYGFPRYSKGCIVSHEVGAMKPDAKIFLHALERAQVSAAGAVFVDDMEVNVEAAQALGIEAFRFENPQQFLREAGNRGLL